MSQHGTSICAACDAELPNGAVFCVACGIRVEGEVARKVDTVQTLGGLYTLPPGEEPANLPRGESLAPGTVVGGKFRIEHLIGHDALGTMYQANEIVSGGRALLKLLNAGNGFDQSAYDQLVQDIAVARQVAHPGIVKVYDTGRHGQSAYIATEQVDGEPLQAWISRQLAETKAIPHDVAVSVTAEIAGILDAAHRAGSVHGHLQPASIILTRAPEAQSASVTMTDFGLSRLAVQAATSATGTGHGGIYYRAPEMLRHAGAATPATDIYSLSVILYELLVGVVPTGHWQPPSAGRSDVPARLDDLIKRGLSTSMALRPQSAAAYRMELLDPAARNVPKPAPPGPKGGGGGMLKSTGITFLGLMGVAAGGFIVDKLITDSASVPQTYAQTASASAEVASPPPPSNAYDYLNGQWLTSDGTPLTVSIDRSGNMTGRGVDAMTGAAISLSGRFSNRTGTLTLSSREMGIMVKGRMDWDGACHINYQLLDPASGMTVMQDQFHVNHPPGQTQCP